MRNDKRRPKAALESPAKVTTPRMVQHPSRRQGTAPLGAFDDETLRELGIYDRWVSTGMTLRCRTCRADFQLDQEAAIRHAVWRRHVVELHSYSTHMWGPYERVWGAGA